MLKSTWVLAAFLLCGAVFTAGCSQQDEAPTMLPPQAQVPVIPQKKPTRVVVPKSVQGRWAAVKIAVLDKDSNQQTIYTVAIGAELKIDEADLVLVVQNFLPSFQMDGTVLTSVSNEPKNPAAQIVISEAGQEVFSGWLFSRYPNTHAFQHPRFSFSLVDCVPAAKNS